jgi:hypothetical protein
MIALDVIKATVSKIAGHFRPRQAEFSCGDCKRVHQCGLPPDRECLVRIIQVADKEARGIGVSRRRLEILGQC